MRSARRLALAMLAPLVVVACAGTAPSAGSTSSSPTSAASVRSSFTLPPSSGVPSRSGPARPAAPYVALPKQLPAPGVLVLHPWWGLVPDVKAYADRLAAAGFVAFAPDLYGDGSTASSIEEAEALSTGVDAEAMTQRTRTALLGLLRRPDVSGRRAGIVAFSMGGTPGSELATGPDARRVAALVLYYDAQPRQAWDRLQGPVLVHQAQSDDYTAPSAVSSMRQAVRAAGGRCQVVVYPGTGHWFAEPHRPQYRAGAAQLAATRTITLLRSALTPP